MSANARIARILNKVRSHHVGYLQSVNQVTDLHDTTGLVAAARLVGRALKSDPPTLVEQRLLNTLVPKVIAHASIMPGNLAVSVFNSLSEVKDHRALSVLAGIQDRWLEGWKESALEKSTKRPKTKLDLAGLYSSDSRSVRTMKIPRCTLIESLDDDTLERAVKYMAATHAHDPKNIEYIALIVRAFLKEYTQRSDRNGTQYTDDVREFITAFDKQT